MAKQISPFKFIGNIGDLNFALKDGEYIVREKPKIAKSRILNDPEFARTRENMVEFDNVQNARKLFNAAFLHARNGLFDSKASNRLSSDLADIKNFDIGDKRGDRKVSGGFQSEAGNAIMLNYNFNRHSKLRCFIASLFC